LLRSDTLSASASLWAETFLLASAAEKIGSTSSYIARCASRELGRREFEAFGYFACARFVYANCPIRYCDNLSDLEHITRQGVIVDSAP